MYLINEDKEPKEQHEPEMKELEEVYRFNKSECNNSKKLEQAEEELAEYKALVQKWLEKNGKVKPQPTSSNPAPAQTNASSTA